MVLSRFELMPTIGVSLDIPWTVHRVVADHIVAGLRA